MQIVDKNIKDLIPYVKNPRKNDGAVEAVANSIKEFGFKVPIVIDSENNVVCGHTRLKAAKKLKLDSVPCVIADDLTDEQIKAFRLADNKVGELAEWDFDLLDEELDSIFDIDMSQLGFSVDNDDETPAEAVEDDYDAAPPEEPRSKPGQIYRLGNHVVMCGDSSNPDDVRKLMNGEKACMVFTDPPYNMSYSNNRSERTKNVTIRNDDLGHGFFDFILQVFKNMDDVTSDCCWFYIWHNYYCQADIERALAENGIEIRNQIIWVKDIPAYTQNLYRSQHEECFQAVKKNAEIVVKQVSEDCFYCKKKDGVVFVESGHDSTVWNIPSIQSAKSIDEFGQTWFKGGSAHLNLHPTQKPIKLASKALIYSSDKDDIVLDLFGGSGSTLIACEQLHRRCYIMEYEPKYVDVIIDRWENFTGETAVKVN